MRVVQVIDQFGQHIVAVKILRVRLAAGRAGGNITAAVALRFVSIAVGIDQQAFEDFAAPRHGRCA